MVSMSQLWKGAALEELLRAYFLRAGFYVIRGAPYQLEGEDITDVDLWLYECPTGTARRRQIVDAKAKSRPKAVERLLWTKGLAEALKVDGAYIATKDSRTVLRAIAKKLGVALLDGKDIERITNSSKVAFKDRMPDEELWTLVKSVDKQRHNKELQNSLIDLKGAVLDGFGINSLVRSLDAVKYFANQMIDAYPGSPTATVSGRLALFSASIACISLDFVGMEAPFQTTQQHHQAFVNAIRYGAASEKIGLEKIRLATGLIREYVENGDVVARTVEDRVKSDFDAIPAEIIAEQAVRMTGDQGLFEAGRQLEHACYSCTLVPFDDLGTSSKAILGAILDYCSIDRSSFAKATKNNESKRPAAKANSPKSAQHQVPERNLFDDGIKKPNSQ